MLKYPGRMSLLDHMMPLALGTRQCHMRAFRWVRLVAEPAIAAMAPCIGTWQNRFACRLQPWLWCTAHQDRVGGGRVKLFSVLSRCTGSPFCGCSRISFSAYAAGLCREVVLGLTTQRCYQTPTTIFVGTHLISPLQQLIAQARQDPHFRKAFQTETRDIYT